MPTIISDSAMALATGPKLLLLDEPTAGMGPEDSGRIKAFLEGLTAVHDGAPYYRSVNLRVGRDDKSDPRQAASSANP